MRGMSGAMCCLSLTNNILINLFCCNSLSNHLIYSLS